MQLYIGNKNYSTWSLRVWLLLEKFGLEYDEIKLNLATESFYQGLEGVSPTQKVPVLVDDDVTVWESLAILEYINESYLSGAALPISASERARARALCAEMHSSFRALKNAMPMNIRAKRHIEVNPQVLKDIQRVEAIFTEQMQRYKQKDGWLFGDWSMVDAMFAPVCLRFDTYGVELNARAQKYVEQVFTCPVLSRWRDQALLEEDVVRCNETGVDR
ncbi:glutathione S-transferase family protein [Pseudoalteromonas luteoviolacea]|uniref:glutathione S-transferase family protein n=1 Tax=Pseudoalteromonas luteoviolacea TaxID=43657 RepID=UPI001F3A5659|nr:glutathione S-transferase family protein [Pseudoalteromonas luteoviolacea]MCF6441901.1 glutathione S-transferase family protein [Pseudoalteromonas luteoviolacea]